MSVLPDDLSTMCPQRAGRYYSNPRPAAAGQISRLHGIAACPPPHLYAARSASAAHCHPVLHPRCGRVLL